jgi:hypothetical protein
MDVIDEILINPNWVTVKLEWLEVMHGAWVGVRRRICSLNKNRHDNKRWGKVDCWTLDIEGSCCELAVAKALNRHWAAPIDNFKEPDILPNFQVRLGMKLNHKLIVRDDDPDEHIYILGVGAIPVFYIVGWMTGSDARQQRWLKDPHEVEPAYFVPQNELQHISELV